MCVTYSCNTLSHSPIEKWDFIYLFYPSYRLDSLIDRFIVKMDEWMSERG